MPRPLVPPAFVVVAAVCDLAGAGSLAHLALLAGVIAAALAVLDVVTERVARRAGIGELLLAVGSLTAIVCAAAMRAPLLALPAVLLSALRPLADDLRSPVPALDASSR